MTNVGRMALRRRPTRRLLNSSLLNRSYMTRRLGNDSDGPSGSAVRPHLTHVSVCACSAGSSESENLPGWTAWLISSAEAQRWRRRC